MAVRRAPRPLPNRRFINYPSHCWTCLDVVEAGNRVCLLPQADSTGLVAVVGCIDDLLSVQEPPERVAAELDSKLLPLSRGDARGPIFQTAASTARVDVQVHVVLESIRTQDVVV